MVKAFLAAVVGLALVSAPAWAEPSLLEETMACQGDVLRLCASDVPNRPAIIACMQRQRASLSQRCGVVFDEALQARAARQGNPQQ